MTQITESQYDSLVQKIYLKIMDVTLTTEEGEEVTLGMGEMGEARDMATEAVDQWMKDNDITLN